MKKLLLSLFVCVVGFTCFSSAGSYGPFSSSQWLFNGAVGDYSYSKSISSDELICYRVYQFTNGSLSCTDNYGNVINGSKYFCYTDLDLVFSCYKNTTSSRSLEFFTMTGLNNCPVCSPQYTSEECQSEYGLVSSGLLNECQSSLQSCQSNTSGFNDLLNECHLNLNACNSSLTSCLQSNCPDVAFTGDLLYSNLYINDILHPGTQNIFLNIPDYIMWDYNVVGDDFNIFVGSGYDVDYINSIIDINSYRPTSSDFTNVFVGGLTLIFPYIVIVLFIVFIRKLIKRIFK